ncbi:MAG: PQQ-dependent sugar dehydrogenase [Acidobacteriota bacterium]
MADVLPKDYRMEPVMRGLTRPSAMALAPDGRIFYLERTTGNVRVIRNGKLLSNNYIHVDVSTTAEEGLLGIVLHPDFQKNGYLYIYYTQLSPKTNRIVRYVDQGSNGSSATVILDNIGSAAGGNNNGGGLVFGNDGKLYATVGDMESSGDAQLLSSLKGKVLRMNDDGTAPADNPYPGEPYPYSLIYSIGFRNPTDIAMNKNVGTIYDTDAYDGTTQCDETNVVKSGTNYGWDVEFCQGSSYEPALHSLDPMNISGLSPYLGSKYPGFENNLFIAGETDGKIVRDVLSGSAYDTFSSTASFYDSPSGTECPIVVKDLTDGRDSWLYAVSDDSTSSRAGIYRVIRDQYGYTNAKPREVSNTPYLNMTLAKDGSGLRLWWEDLKKDVWTCSDANKDGNCDAAGSKTKRYTIWQGTLNSPFSYTHTKLAETEGDGTSQNDALRSYGIGSMPSGNVYYLVSGRGANLEGTAGYKTGGAERPGYSSTESEICNAIGWGETLGKCTNDWAHTYPDQDGNMRSIHEFRGKAVFITMMQYG